MEEDQITNAEYETPKTNLGIAGKLLIAGAFVGTFAVGYKLGQQNLKHNTLNEPAITEDDTDRFRTDIEKDAEDVAKDPKDYLRALGVKDAEAEAEALDSRLQRSFEESQTSLEDSYRRMEHDLKRNHIVNGKWILTKRGIFEDGTPFGNMAGLTYILNQNGEPISSGFDDIIPTEECYVGIFGYKYTKLDKNGRTLEEKFAPNFAPRRTEEEDLERDRHLRTEAVVIPEKFETKRFFHETGRLSDGTTVGKLGACWYVLDNAGDPISGGFHEINPTSNGYVGEIGSKIVKLNKDGRPLTRKFAEVFPK